AAGLGGPHHHRRDAPQPDGAWVHLPARPALGGAGGGLAESNRYRPRRRGPHLVQLMHAGRVSHSSLLPDHALPVAPSAIAVSGQVHTFGGKEPFETPRPLEIEEIPAVIEEYRRAAELSITAGFDGVELHAA